MKENQLKQFRLPGTSNTAESENHFFSSCQSIESSLIEELQRKIKRLEEFCLNVDFHNISVPKDLEYLFKKEKNQRSKFSESNNSLAGYSFFSNEQEYFGDTIQDVPSGIGKIIYSSGKNGEPEVYYEGKFVNGKRHGEGVQIDLRKGREAKECYKWNRLHGLCEYREGQTISYKVFVEGLEQHVCKRVFLQDNKQEYINIKDDQWNGDSIEFFKTFNTLAVCSNDPNLRTCTERIKFRKS